MRQPTQLAQESVWVRRSQMLSPLSVIASCLVGRYLMVGVCRDVPVGTVHNSAGVRVGQAVPDTLPLSYTV